MKSSILPLFTTDYSVGKSILTVEKAEDINEREPISITSIAKKYNLSPVFLIESTMTGFIKAFKHFDEINTHYVFGLRLVVVPSMKNKSEESFLNESKIVVLLNNSDGYSDLVKIFSAAATEGKYYVPRIDWVTLKKLWSKNLSLAIPMYDSFLANNLLTWNTCIPDFPEEPVFFMEDHGLPFDGMISDAILKYCKANGNEIIHTHSIFYYKNADVLPYQVYRCIDNRSTYAKPNLQYFSSDRFSFESYLDLVGGKL